MRGSHGLPPSLLGPIGKRFRRQTVPHVSTQEACPTRIRKVLRLVAPLAPVLRAQKPALAAQFTPEAKSPQPEN